MPRGRPITNRSNYFSDHHHGVLVLLANQICRQMGGGLDLHELVNVGWFSQARYHESVVGKAAYIKREMYKWVMREPAGVLERFSDNWDEVYAKF